MPSRFQEAGEGGNQRIPEGMAAGLGTEIRFNTHVRGVRSLPEGEIITKKAWNVIVPAGESYGRVESPKGELGYYIVSDKGSNPYRYHVRSPSFVNLTTLEKMCQGHMVADSVVILGSLDIVLGEVDR